MVKVGTLHTVCNCLL